MTIDVDGLLQRIEDGVHDGHSIWKTIAEVAFAQSRSMTRDEWLERYEAVEEDVDGEPSFVEREKK